MKKIIFLSVLSGLFCNCGNKQQPEITSQTSAVDVELAVDLLMKGIMTTDKNLLQSITADELVYGHSSGKVQNKSEFIAEICSGDPFVYQNIELLDQKIQMAGTVAVVRHIFTSDTKNTAGEPGNLRIGVMQIWYLQNNVWKLLARQAYKL